MKRVLPFVLLLVFMSACTLAKVKVDVASERTTLENQVLGSYNSLTGRVMLAASVRGVEPSGKISAPAAMSGDGSDAAEAVRVLAFHADDVDSFKRLGWVGERNDGLLEAFEMQRAEVPDDLQGFATRYGKSEFAAVVKDVNDARMKVMRRVVETNPDITPDDMAAVQAVFGKLNGENALPGEKVQDSAGQWVVVQ